MNKTVLNKSYQITFLMLICITVIVYIRSLNKQLNNKQTLSLQLAGLVTSISAFHYYYMMKTNTPVVYRYFDWIFTTPILLLDLLIILDIYNFKFFVKIVILNTIMLLFGYLGEVSVISITSSAILGFIPFILMFYMIRKKINVKTNDQSKSREKTIDNRIYSIFAGLWLLYGANHLMPNIEIKNTSYNILDLLTKGIFALYLYYRSW